MTLGDYIKWCGCTRAILRSGQMKINGGQDKCDYCEKEHAASLKDRMDIGNNFGEVKNDTKRGN